MQAVSDDEAADFQEGDHGQGQEALGQDVCRRRDDGGCDEGQEDDVFPFFGQHGRRDEIQLGQDDEDQWQVEEDAEGQDQHEDEIQVIHTYEDVFCYDVHTDTALAGQLLHDIMKPFVFQWQPDGSCLKEYTIAGQGAHHVISIAESMYRSLLPDVVVAQACAHGAPNDAKGEADVVAWLKAASLMAQKAPVAYGVLNKMGNGLPSPHRQEGYIVHLGDHDWVLSSPAGQKTSVLLKKIAVQQYGMSDGDSQGAKFNYFKNYVESQLSCMYLNMLQAEPDGERLVAQAVAKVIVK